MQRRTVCCALALLAALAPWVPASEEATREPDAPCSAKEYREFDFWVGEWDVVNRTRPDAPTARSSITLEQGGCVIRESYRAAGGYSGTSLTFYDATAGRWHQTWIDNQGQPIWFEGGFEDGRLTLVSPDRRFRMFFAEQDGTVLQLFETSQDGGETWTTLFDGVYTRRP